VTDVGNTTHLDIALTYAREYGWKVFPVHGVTYDERGVLNCTCGAGDACDPKNRGKHPATPHGFKDAVGRGDKDWEIKIRSWWSARPGCNIGVATGQGSGIFVVDVDVKNGDGPTALAAWWSEAEETPWSGGGTLAERSGSGGLHYVFRYPEDGEKVPTRVGWLDSVDVRSDGGYVVVAPSVIPAGRYEWVTSGVAPAYPSSALLEAIRSGSGLAGQQGGFHAAVDEIDFLNGRVAEGTRNDTFFSFALRWLHKYMGDQNLVLGLLQSAWNNLPAEGRDSFPPEEVIKIFRSALDRYTHQKEQDVVSDAWIRTYMQGQGVESPEAEGWGGLPPPSPLDVSSVEGGLITAPDGFPLTDVGNAQRLMAVYGPHVRHTTGMGWLAWDSSRWSRESADKTLERYAGAVVRSLLVDFIPKLRDREVPDEVVKRVMLHWKISESLGRLKAMVALSEEKADWPSAGWDAEPLLFNCVNGTVDLRTGELRPHSPSDYLTRLSGVRYEEGATAPRWEAFMRRMLPDPEVRAYVQRAVGYTLTGLVDEKCFFILHGAGNNGKTMFTETLGWVMGEYWNAAPKSVFIGYGNKQDGHPTDLAKVAGARYVTCGEEVQERDHLAESRLKSMTGGDRMTARFMHQDFFDFNFMGKLWLNTNYRPKLSDFSEALRSRLHLVPWDVALPEAERRPRSEVLGEFIAEGSGIFNWALEGCMRWREIGLRRPEAVVRATEGYLREENLVEQFSEDCLEMGGFTSTKDLVKAYRWWLGQQGHSERAALGARSLGVALKVLGFEDAKINNMRGWSAALTVAVPDWA
jgi:putative DNA primase/helicase